MVCAEVLNEHGKLIIVKLHWLRTKVNKMTLLMKAYNKMNEISVFAQLKMSLTFDKQDYCLMIDSTECLAHHVCQAKRRNADKSMRISLCFYFACLSSLYRIRWIRTIPADHSTHCISYDWIKSLEKPMLCLIPRLNVYWKMERENKSEDKTHVMASVFFCSSSVVLFHLMSFYLLFSYFVFFPSHSCFTVYGLCHIKVNTQSYSVVGIFCTFSLCIVVELQVLSKFRKSISSWFWALTSLFVASSTKKVEIIIKKKSSDFKRWLQWCLCSSFRCNDAAAPKQQQRAQRTHTHERVVVKPSISHFHRKESTQQVMPHKALYHVLNMMFLRLLFFSCYLIFVDVLPIAPIELECVYFLLTYLLLMHVCFYSSIETGIPFVLEFNWFDFVIGESSKMFCENHFIYGL